MARLVVLAAFAAVALAQIPVNVDDRDPRVVYQSPGEPWTVHTQTDASFRLYNNSDTFTGIQGATITFRFAGTTIQYWGNQGPWHGRCGVNLDGRDYTPANSNAAADGPPIVLFEQKNLATGSDHTIIITVMDPPVPTDYSHPSNVCELDRFVYTSLPNNGGDGYSTAPGPSPTGGNGNNGGNNGGGNPPAQGNSSGGTNWAIVGGAIGAGVGVLLLLVALFLWLRKRKQKKVFDNYVEKVGVKHNISAAPVPPVIASSGKLKPHPPKGAGMYPAVPVHRPNSATSSSYYGPSTLSPPSSPPLTATTTTGFLGHRPPSSGTGSVGYGPGTAGIGAGGGFFPPDRPMSTGSFATSATSTYPSVPTSPTPLLSSPGFAPVDSPPITPNQVAAFPTPGAGPSTAAVTHTAVPAVAGVQSQWPNEKRPAGTTVLSPFGLSVTPGPAASSSSSATLTARPPSSGATAPSTSAPASRLASPPIVKAQLPVAEPSGAGGTSGSGGLVVHQDGGRVQSPSTSNQPVEELPPAYDSAWQGQR